MMIFFFNLRCVTCGGGDGMGYGNMETKKVTSCEGGPHILTSA